MATDSVLETETTAEGKEVVAEAPKVEDRGADKDLVSKLNDQARRLNDQSRLIAGLQREISGLKAVKETAPAKELPAGSQALQEMEKKAIEREQKAIQKQIRSSVLSAMISGGFSEDAAKKLMPSMLQEAAFEVTEDDEVVAQEGEVKRPAKDFIKGILLRDDWKALTPQKRGPDKASGKPVQPQPPISPSENGVYSAKAARAASAGG